MDFCAFCNKELPENTRQRRHRTQDDTRPLCCNREHEVERRKQAGMYKAMSLAGRAARSAAVATSNREKPRRKTAAQREQALWEASWEYMRGTISASDLALIEHT